MDNNGDLPLEPSDGSGNQPDRFKPWTIKGISPEVRHAVLALAARTDASVGELVTLAIKTLVTITPSNSPPAAGVSGARRSPLEEELQRVTEVELIRCGLGRMSGHSPVTWPALLALPAVRPPELGEPPLPATSAAAVAPTPASLDELKELLGVLRALAEIPGVTPLPKEFARAVRRVVLDRMKATGTIAPPATSTATATI
jgi:hypothetical protein